MAELFHYTFASDLSEFSTTNASNGTIEQSAGAGLNGTTGGVTCARTGNSPNLYGLATETVSSASVVRTAWYTDLSSLTIGTNNDTTSLMRIHISGDTILGAAVVIRVSGVLNFRLYIYRDTGVFLTNTVVKANPLWMEMRIQRATGDGIADGNGQLYAGGGDYDITGEQIAEVTGVANYNKFPLINRQLVGMHNIFATSTSVGGSLKFDEWIFRNDDTPILFGVGLATSGRPYDLDQLLDLTTIRM